MYSASLPVPQSVDRNGAVIPKLLLGALLLLVFYGVAPFSPPQEAVPLGAGGDRVWAVASKGDGDTLRQFAFVALAVACLVDAWLNRRFNAFVTPPTLIVLFSWCAASSLWAIEPGISVRRLILTSIVTFSSFYLVGALGARAAMRTLATILIVLVALDWIAIFAVPYSVHRAGEAANDPALVGNWRGFHPHKNEAGPAMAIAALVLLDCTAREKRAIDCIAAAGAIIFLLMTRSKTSILLFALAASAGVLYAYGWRSALFRRVSKSILLIALPLSVVVLYCQPNVLRGVLDDPYALTGRTLIWRTLLTVADMHPFGVGYASFWNIGPNGPALHYGSDWVSVQMHGHNGYLDILASTGWVGLCLVLLAVVAAPLKIILHPSGTRDCAVLLSIMVFIWLHDLSESSILNRDNAIWTLFAIAYALLRIPRYEGRATRRD